MSATAGRYASVRPFWDPSAGKIRTSFLILTGPDLPVLLPQPDAGVLDWAELVAELKRVMRCLE